jgi:hypothetical protein
MGLDIRLDVKKHVSYDDCNTWTAEYEMVFDCYITHNLVKMAEHANLYKVLWRPEELGFEKAEQVLPLLREGLAKLKEDPDTFKLFNPESGWGSYENLVNVVGKYIEACETWPKAEIEVSR